MSGVLSAKTSARSSWAVEKFLSLHHRLKCSTCNKRLLSVQENIVIILLCGNKMPSRCNRGFYCRSYCLLNMFRAPLCPSSGAQEYYTVVAACGISCCDFQVAGLVWSWGICAPVCRMLQHPANRTHNPQLHTRPATWKPQHEIPQAATTV